MKMAAIKTQRPEFGRLVWIDNITGNMQVIRIGRWAELQARKKALKEDPSFRGGKLHIKYL